MASKKTSKTKKASTCAQKKTRAEDLDMERYRHTAETELAQIVVSLADEDEEGVLLQAYLQVLKEENGDYKKKLNEQDHLGMTALHFAVSAKKLVAVRILIKHGASVDIKDRLGFTPLFLATGRYSDHDIANYLLSVGNASVGVKTNTGVTALHGASLMGNIDSVKLLLKRGADPHSTDNDHTSPLDVAKDDATRLVLYKAANQKDKAIEKQDSACAQCGKGPSESGSLKRCSQCHVTLYCSKTCQVQHWKNGHKAACEGYVIAHSNDESCRFNTMLNIQHKNLAKLYMQDTADLPEQMEFLRGKRFIVKVQLPISGFGSGAPCLIMVYSEDRSVQGFINQNESGYGKITKMIREHGYCGIKAFFWAEMTDQRDGSFKVYHGKCAPYQTW